MRVGVDFHTFDGIFQGSRSHILGLFRQVIELAPDMHFYFFLGTPEALLAADDGFGAPNVTLVKMRPASGVYRLGIQLPLLQKKYKLDLLHMQYRLPFVSVGPCACTMHDILFETHPQFFSRFFTLQSRLTFQYAARRAQLLFTVSQFSQQEIAKRYGVPQSRIQVVYNGVDRDRFFPGDAGCERLAAFGLSSKNYILTVGRLEPRKNHVRLIEAYASLDGDVPPLVCVGQKDFGYQPALDAARRLGIEEKVLFLEHIDDQTLPLIMRHCSCFVFPALAEGFGMPVVEAMASGVPVITSRSTSLTEIAGDGALLVDPLDVSSITDGLAAVMRDPDFRQRLCRSGLDQSARFTWRKSAQILVDAYRSFSLS
ncbi:MAG: hypothetical protein CSA33_02200 [Desulfobulbus propionicus]|nr:MAG: hypothetical protein CSA33_02200 [Desulfobulbus propionicus]